jgi:3-hydroxyanthranilate 3,4-dioxygenase
MSICQSISINGSKPTSIAVQEDEMYLLPSHVRHSLQRPEGCIGLVIERYRQPGEVDALAWYDEQEKLEFRGEFRIENTEQDLEKVQNAWKEWRGDPTRPIPTVWRVGA